MSSGLLIMTALDVSHGVQLILHTTHCTLHTAHCKLSTANCALSSSGQGMGSITASPVVPAPGATVDNDGLR